MIQRIGRAVRPVTHNRRNSSAKVEFQSDGFSAFSEPHSAGLYRSKEASWASEQSLRAKNKMSDAALPELIFALALEAAKTRAKT